MTSRPPSPPARRPRALAAVLRLLAVAGGLVVLLWLVAWEVHRPLRPGAIESDGGRAWLVRDLRLPRWLWHGTDGLADATGSRLRLLEDGRPLGPAHASHPVVRAQGGGAFSHWGESLWFSTPDGSDPRSNGRAYTVAVPLQPSGPWVLLGLVAALLPGVRPAWSRLRALRAPPRLLPALGLCALGLGVALHLGLWWLALDPPRIRRTVPADRLQSYAPAGTAAGAVPLWSLDLFGATVDWNVPAFGRAAWPETSDDRPGVQLHVGGRTAVLVPSVAAAAAHPGDAPAFTVLAGMALVARAPAGAGWEVGLAVLPSQGARWLATALALGGLALWLGGRRRQPRHLATALVHAGVLAAAPAAALLLAANLLGLATAPLRAPDAPQLWQPGLGPGDRRLDWPAARPQLARRAHEADHDYAARLCLLVADTVAHAWNRRLRAELRMQVPVHENWLLWLHGELDDDAREYDFADPHKGLERGIGLCAHTAGMLIRLLRPAGIDARLVQLGGHTVVAAFADGLEFVLDPDYGVVLAGSLAELAQEPERVEAAYAAALARTGYSPAAATAARVAGLYDPADNSVGEADGSSGVSDPQARWEAAAYLAKWLLPLGVLALATALRARPGPRPCNAPPAV